ncbi:magnesium transporter [Sphingobacteriales bacterium CHB3]|nr:magnesium transporter [Sphingobacteriales bacterium CHB3]
MIGKTIQPEIRALIDARDFATLKELFADWNPADLADLIDDLPYEDQAIIFRLLPRALAADTYEYLAHEKQANLLKAMGQEQVGNILNDMDPDDRTALFEELPSAAVQQLIALLSPQERAVAQSLLNYPEDSIGRLMTPDFIAVKMDWTVQDVLNYVRANGHDKETLNVIYVVDDKGKLIDDLRIREFLLAPLEKKVSEMMDENYASLPAHADRETAIEVFKKYNRTALPVVDSNEHLLGIVTVDDVLQVQEEETTEDIQKIGGTEAFEQPYLEISVPKMVRKRAGWLVVLFLGEMFTATAMGFFEEEIAKAVVLALFVPLIISSGGNSGSQAATLIIRAMALGEVTLATWWRVMRREIIAGLSLGSILGTIGFLRIALWTIFTDIYGEHWFLVALTVGMSLVGVVLWGSLTGSMMPFIMRRFGADPATSSAPFVATLVDVTGLVIYFSIAAIILSGTLL